MNYTFTQIGYTTDYEDIYACDDKDFSRFFVLYHQNQQNYRLVYKNDNGNYETLMQDENPRVVMDMTKVFFMNYTVEREKMCIGNW